MIDLRQCKFGDKLVTRGGIMAIYVSWDNNGKHTLILKSKKYKFLIIDKYYNDGICHFFDPRSSGKYDIVFKHGDKVECTRMVVPGTPEWLAPIIYNNK